MDINEYSKYVVVKPIKMNEGTIPVNTELTCTHGCVYFNGGLVPPGYQDSLSRLIMEERQNGFKYLRPQGILRDKI